VQSFPRGLVAVKDQDAERTQSEFGSMDE
jgi:hypothetical protein